MRAKTRLGSSSKSDQDVCVKCKKCGVPRIGRFDKKARAEKRSLIQQMPNKYPVATSQLAAVCIQKLARSFLVRNRRKKNLPINKWQQKCVHYLSKRGPYGRVKELDCYRRIGVYRAAAIQMQFAWRKYRWLKYLSLLSLSLRNKNAIVIQRIWRAISCRRSCAAVCDSLRSRKENDSPDALMNLIDSKLIELYGNHSDLSRKIMFRLGGSSVLTLFYKVLLPKSINHSSICGIDSQNTTKTDSETEIAYETTQMEWVGHPSAATLKPVNWEERKKGWHAVDSDKFKEYVLVQMKRRKEREEKHRRKTRSMNQRSKKEDIKERKRENLRKKSQMKWKWFYGTERKDGVCTSSEAHDDEDDLHADVMEWIMNLDIGSLKEYTGEEGFSSKASKTEKKY